MQGVLIQCMRLGLWFFKNILNGLWFAYRFQKLLFGCSHLQKVSQLFNLVLFFTFIFRLRGFVRLNTFNSKQVYLLAFVWLFYFVLEIDFSNLLHLVIGWLYFLLNFCIRYIFENLLLLLWKCCFNLFFIDFCLNLAFIDRK